MGALESQAVASRLLVDLPDVPRWLETRAMLRSPHVTVTGGQDGGEVGWVVRLVHGAISAVAVVGRPPAAAIGAALEGVTELTPIMAQDDNADHVERALIDLIASRGGRPPKSWTRERVILHRLTSSPALPHVHVDQTFAIRLLTRGDSLDHLFPELRHEIAHAREMAPVAAAFVGGQPVSFCYPVWTTESMWDVSIDTLPEHRRRGLAAHVSHFMTERMRREGREPIWAALESNAASLGLAARLGFAPADECVVFSHGSWVFLSGGFDTQAQSALRG